MQAPENFYNAKEEKTVTLSYAGQNAEAVFSETTFINDRQKAKVSVVKKDKDTEKPLDGGIFGLYAGNDIVNADGIVVVKKGSLIEKAFTGEDGTAIFTNVWEKETSASLSLVYENLKEYISSLFL